jgi:CRP/FNR family cyclic AMP-dependent transcriptional regulator
MPLKKPTQALPPSSLGLRGIKLLQGLEPPVLEDLARRCAWRRYEAGQTLFTRDSPGREVYMLSSGRVRITIYTASGRQVTFRDMAGGDTLGEVAAVDEGQRSADATALSDVLVAVFSPNEFKQVLREQPEVAERFMRQLAALIRKLTEKVVELSTLGVQNRIHADLLRLAREGTAAHAAAAGLISPSPRHVEIASRVSTTREQVTRELSALARRGLLEKATNGLLVKDLAALERMVEQASLEA